MSGAKLQRVLNRAAYEENVRRAAGSALTYGVQEKQGEAVGREGGRGYGAPVLWFGSQKHLIGHDHFRG